MNTEAIETMEAPELLPTQIFSARSGSHAYGLATPTSDLDTRGVFVQHRDEFYGLRYVEQINNASHDVVFYELRRFLQMVSKNNPNILELLWMPEDCVLFKHPIFDLILQHRNSFLSKLCRHTFGGYAVEQIKKARGLNKKITKTFEQKRRSILDFCFVLLPDGYSTITLQQFLQERDIPQEECGLSAIPHMPNFFALFHNPLLPYRGIIDGAENTDIRLSSIPKGEKIITQIFYNKPEFSQYCREYREYWEWVERRNPHRYAENVKHGKGYDGKNLMHCHRLLDMCLEIGRGEGVNVRRPNREELLAIRRGDAEYEELIRSAEEKIAMADTLFAETQLPDKPDVEMIEEVCRAVREQYYKEAKK